MTRRDVVNDLYINTSLPKKYIDMILVSFFDTIKENLISGKSIYLRGFGTFLVKKRNEATRRNPKTNEKIVISPHNVAYFKPGKKLKKIDKISNQEIPLEVGK